MNALKHARIFVTAVKVWLIVPFHPSARRGVRAQRRFGERAGEGGRVGAAVPLPDEAVDGGAYKK